MKCAPQNLKSRSCISPTAPREVSPSNVRVDHGPPRHEAGGYYKNCNIRKSGVFWRICPASTRLAGRIGNFGRSRGRPALTGNEGLNQPAAAQVHEKEAVVSVEQFLQVDRPHIAGPGEKTVAMVLPASKVVALVPPPDDRRFDLAVILRPQLLDREIALDDGPREDAAGEVLLRDFPPPGAQEISHAAHALQVPERLPQPPQFLGGKLGAA